MPSVLKPSASHTTKSQPRVLVVDDEPDLRELISDVAGSMNCRITAVSTLADAREVLSIQDVDVLVLDVHLPDGDGLSLLPVFGKRRPGASAIVITGKPSVDNAVSALRHGAVDFLAKPFNNAQITDHIRSAIARAAKAAAQERKISRLKKAVKRLNESRRLVSKKVDILCNDLVTAYGELSRQLEGVRTQEGFRKAIADAVDLEQLLCHSMDWMLREIGYCNVAVWLAGEEGDFQLGAYMKYTLAGDEPLTNALKRVVLPAAANEGGESGATPLHVRGGHFEKELTASERKLLGGQDILAAHCTYLGEGLASLIFFRDEASPFTEDDEALLSAIAPLFALSLASVVRETGEPFDAEGDAEEQSGDNADTTEAGGTADRDPPRGDGKPRKGKQPPKPDPADWWKRGEPPPF